MTAILEQFGGPRRFWPELTPTLMSIRQGPPAAILYQHAIRLRDAGRTDTDLGRMAEVIYGTMFRAPAADPRAELRTDAHRPDLPRRPPPAKE
jgi:hypothetical protein